MHGFLKNLTGSPQNLSISKIFLFIFVLNKFYVLLVIDMVMASCINMDKHWWKTKSILVVASVNYIILKIFLRYLFTFVVLGVSPSFWWEFPSDVSLCMWPSALLLVCICRTLRNDFSTTIKYKIKVQSRLHVYRSI